jgi:hypothetical protein
MVNDLVQSRALCELYPLKQNACNDMESVRVQAQEMFALQDYIDAQYRGPGKGFFRIVRTPTEARRYINEGKLAVVLGVEVSEVLDCGRQGDTPLCDEAQIDAGLDELHALGVRSLSRCTSSTTHSVAPPPRGTGCQTRLTSVNSLLDNPERAALGSGARRRVTEQFLGDRHLIQWVKLLGQPVTR